MGFLQLQQLLVKMKEQLKMQLSLIYFANGYIERTARGRLASVKHMKCLDFHILEKKNLMMM